MTDFKVKTFTCVACFKFMKTLLIILTLCGVASAGFLSYVKNNETYSYEVLKTYDDFEVRKYDAALFTSVRLDSASYKTSSSKGFKILAGYIFGENERSEKIAMTTPVTMDLEEKMTMRFLVPAEFELTDLPKPNHDGIVIEEMPERVVAVVRFSGYANDKKIEAHRTKLAKALQKEGLNYQGAFTFMGYNAPFDPVDRRNEVMVELRDYEL